MMHRITLVSFPVLFGNAFKGLSHNHVFRKAESW
jgi:hypothetical protein